MNFKKFLLSPSCVKHYSKLWKYIMKTKENGKLPSCRAEWTVNKRSGPEGCGKVAREEGWVLIPGCKSPLALAATCLNWSNLLSLCREAHSLMPETRTINKSVRHRDCAKCTRRVTQLLARGHKGKRLILRVSGNRLSDEASFKLRPEHERPALRRLEKSVLGRFHRMRQNGLSAFKGPVPVAGCSGLPCVA